VQASNAIGETDNWTSDEAKIVLKVSKEEMKPGFDKKLEAVEI